MFANIHAIPSNSDQEDVDQDNVNVDDTVGVKLNTNNALDMSLTLLEDEAKLVSWASDQGMNSV